jgi:hypothetical protein
MNAKRYRVVIAGRLSERFTDAFALRAVEVRGNRTILEGDILDQAQLYGLIDSLRDLALELVGVEEVPSCPR